MAAGSSNSRCASAGRIARYKARHPVGVNVIGDRVQSPVPVGWCSGAAVLVRSVLTCKARHRILSTRRLRSTGRRRRSNRSRRSQYSSPRNTGFEGVFYCINHHAASSPPACTCRRPPMAYRALASCPARFPSRLENLPCPTGPWVSPDRGYSRQSLPLFPRQAPACGRRTENAIGALDDTESVTQSTEIVYTYLDRPCRSP